MIKSSQLPEKFAQIINAEMTNHRQDCVVEDAEEVPKPGDIPIDNSCQKWLRVHDVICVYVDMQNSTGLSSNSQDTSMARAYQLFTATAVRLFREFGAPYVDIKGDGVFALFNRVQPYTALASAITFKTFAHEAFVPTIRQRTDVKTGSHIGIDQKTLLVRRLGLRGCRGRSDWQNEVWAGKTVNMAAKLASFSEHNELLISERYYDGISSDCKHACGCQGFLMKKTFDWHKWDGMPLFNSPFDFNTAYSLKENWCPAHGAQSCEHFLRLDKDRQDQAMEKATTDYLKLLYPRMTDRLK